MPIEKALKMTLNEVLIMQLGNQRKYEQQMHGVRLIMWEMRIKHLKKGKTIQPSDIFKLSFDDDSSTPKRMSKQEFLNLIKKSATDGKAKN